MNPKRSTINLTALVLGLGLLACDQAFRPPTVDLADDTLDPGPAVVLPAPTEEELAIAEAELAAVPEPAPAPEAPIDPAPLAARFALKHGETLHHFARWSGLPVEDLAEASGLDLDAVHPVGAAVVVPGAGDEETARIGAQRVAHHARRAEGYLASRGGAVGVEVVKVRTGDSATTIAREQMGIPVWLLQVYNPDADLEHIRPGQQLLVPVVADVVVDADLVETL